MSDGDDFRKLVEGRMTSEEYVDRLKERVERRRDQDPAVPRERRGRRRIHDWVDYLRGSDRRIT